MTGAAESPRRGEQLLSRRIDKPIQVTLIRDEAWDAMRPAAFTWRRGRYVVVEVLDRWEETGRWWEQEMQLTVWRVACRDGGVYELAVAHTQPPEWRLMAIHD